MPTDVKQRLATLSDEQRRLLANRLAKAAGAGRPLAIAARPRTSSELPLSFAQQRIWFLSQVGAINTAFNVGEVNRLRGPLDLDALERSLNEIIRRHEALRTTFVAGDGLPVQRIADRLELRVAVESLGDVASEEREAALNRLVAQEFSRPWDLETGPLIRARVWQLAADDHVVVILIHHIVSDGWSKNVFVRELAALYRAFSRREPSPLPALPIQYADFAAWQREWVATQEFDRQLDYWKKDLAGVQTLQLPGDHGAQATSSGLHRWMVLPAPLYAGLKAFAQGENATLFMTLLAAFAALLGRYSRQDEVTIGSPVANRTRVEVENLIGCFMNPVPLRIDLSGHPTFRQLVGRVRETALGAYAHQDVPFDLLVRAVQPRREAGAAPLFQAMFLLHNFQWQALELNASEMAARPIAASRETLAGIPAEPVPGDLVYPVALEMFEVGEQLLASFEYSTEFARVFAGAPGHFQTLLEGVITNPDRPLRDHPIVTTGERQLVEDWIRQDRRQFAVRPVHEIFQAQAARTPDRIAVTFRRQTLTYAELNAQANQLARRLQASGVGPEVPVAILLDRSLEAIVAVLATLKAGGAYVPLDPNYPGSRHAFVMRDAGVRVVVTNTQLADRTAELFAAASSAGDAPALMLLDRERDSTASQATDNLPASACAANLAYLVYTSGSTGLPKGTMVTHGSFANAYFAWEEAYRLRTDVSAHLQMASISFDVFSGDLVRALCSGGKLVLVPADYLFSPAELYRLMRDEQVDCAEFVPAVARDLVRYVEESRQRLDFLRLMIVGSDSLFGNEYTQLRELCGPGTRVINSYGLTEATIDSSYFEADTVLAASGALTPIGRAFPNTELYVIDSAMQLAPVGVPGELCIGGAGLARGYLARPDLTAERFIPHPASKEPGARLYRTGDLVRFGADGNLDLLGRIDQQVKLRGFRIEVGEIEAVLATHPSVSEAVVALREDVPGDKRLVAYVVAADSGTVNTSELRRFVRDTLPEYMVPSAVLSLDALPLTPNGKIDRRALPAVDRQRDLEQAYVAPSTDLERTIAAIWRDVLQVETVGVHDNFFDLGGHSLLVVQLHGRLRQSLEQELTVIDLFAFPTVHALASKLADRRRDVDNDFDSARLRAMKQRDAFKRRRLAAESRVVTG